MTKFYTERTKILARSGQKSNFVELSK